MVQAMGATEGSFDRRYFDRWYRDGGFGSPARLRRHVAYALGAAEYLLDRPVRSVLDVGCGEGAWQPDLARLRPRARYVGVDPSRYAVERFGARRNLRQGHLGQLGELELGGPFDLVVCVGVLGYVDAPDVRRGLAAITAALGGVALLEVFTASDAIVGDVTGYRRRPAGRYRRWFAEAGLARVGPHLYAGADLLDRLATFEGSADRLATFENPAEGEGPTDEP
jgi:SAM-dependent methyltransferase